jgi:ArsR family transcriptional regulator, arsenate/arsenite/antimonite-responsive transcriptional repressor
MGATKYSAYKKEHIELARIFKALAHPARIAIVEKLLSNKNLNCKGLSDFIDLAQSTISEHMKVLQESGILGVITENNNAYYQVLENRLEILTQHLNFLKKNTPIQDIFKENIYVSPLYSFESAYFMCMNSGDTNNSA